MAFLLDCGLAGVLWLNSGLLGCIGELRGRRVNGKEFVVEAIFGQDHKLLVEQEPETHAAEEGRTTRPVTDAAKSTTAPAARLKPTESTRRTNEGLSNTSTSKAKKLPEAPSWQKHPEGDTFGVDEGAQSRLPTRIRMTPNDANSCLV
ncbi:hypothetical protein C8R44DRAFT_755109 [Mycena epipterygia]|nr:hypothetical protein C8R44DRAFT_755109 [Mycena epipterygia]